MLLLLWLVASSNDNIFGYICYTGVRSGINGSSRPCQQMSPCPLPGADFALWLQSFSYYIAEVGIDASKQEQELLSLLEDEPFRVADQLILLVKNPTSRK